MEKIKKLLHDVLGWGFAREVLSNPGETIFPIYACRFCPSELSKDSQGNWFHLTSPTSKNMNKSHE